MSQSPGRRPRRSTGPGAAGRGVRGGSTARTGGATRGGSRPAASRPATAPTAAATGTARRAGRGTSAPVPVTRVKAARSTIARQVAALGLVLCAVALTVAYPLRSYFAQRSALGEVVAAQQSLQRQTADLEAQKAALSDPDYIKAEAKRRLRYVTPGDTVYRIVLPPQAAAKAGGGAAAAPAQPWYAQLWDTVTDDSAGTGSARAPAGG